MGNEQQAAFSNVADAPESLSVSLPITREMVTQLDQDARVLTVAEAYLFDAANPEDFRPLVDIANAAMRESKDRIAAIKAWKTRFVQPAKDIIATAEAFFDPAIKAHQASEAHLKGVLFNWQKYETGRIEAEQRKRDEEARRIRQEADQKAAAERARAAQAAEEERRKAEAAEQERQRLEAEAARLREEGDKAAAARAAQQASAAAAERARREEAANAKLEEGEHKAQTAELDSQAVTLAARPVSTAQLPSGFSTRENWVAELLNPNDEAGTILAIARELEKRPELVAYLKLDMSAASKAAKAQKQHMNIPGMRSVNKPIPTSRKAS